jgi:hypothetical protein
VHSKWHTAFLLAQPTDVAQRYPDFIVVQTGQIKEYEVCFPELLVAQIAERYAVFLGNEHFVTKMAEHECEAFSIRRAEI